MSAYWCIIWLKLLKNGFADAYRSVEYFSIFARFWKIKFVNSV